MKLFCAAALAALALAGCSSTPASPAQSAENQDCTAQADAQYQQNTLNEAGHTDQTGLMFPATPNHVFDSENMGAEHVRESQIQDCENTGNNNGQPQVNGVPVVAPHIITQ